MEASKAWSGRFVILTSSILALKLFLAIITPLGYDFVLYMSLVVGGDKTFSWSPWIILVQNIYSFWLWLPLDHGNLLRAIAVTPAQLLPAHFLLAALVKSPLILSDMVAAFLIYRLAIRLSDSPASARAAAALWLANPLVTLFVEMWGSIDIIVVTLALAAVTLVVMGRGISSATALAAGITLKISPIVTWMALLAWLHRQKSSRRIAVPVFLAGFVGIAGYFLWLNQGDFGLKTMIQILRSIFLFGILGPISASVTQTFTEYSIGAYYGYKLGLAVAAVTAYYLICAEIWPDERWSIVPLALSGVLLLYAFTVLFPTAFLWAMPFVALWHSKNLRSVYPPIFFGLVAFYLIAFYNSILTLGGLSFLFVPLKMVPFGNRLADAILSANRLTELGFGPQIRSAFSGFSVAFAASMVWRSLRKARN